MPADRIQENTLSHTASTFGEEYVDLLTNQSEPVERSPVISFEGPPEYENTRYVGRQHNTFFVPRTVEEHTADNSGSLTVNSAIQPIAGETDLERQDYPVAVLVNVTDGGTVVDITDVDYATNTLHFAAQDNGDTLKAYPIITEGVCQYQGVNQFGQIEGTLDKWSVPLYRFHDMEQDKRGTRVNLQGAIDFSRSERFELLVESPHTVVWEDEHYPDAFVSRYEQKVEISL